MYKLHFLCCWPFQWFSHAFSTSPHFHYLCFCPAFLLCPDLVFCWVSSSFVIFKSWKMMLWKCCTQYASKFGKLSGGQGLVRSVFIPIPEKGYAKECSNYCTIALISLVSKIMLKILQARLQHRWTVNFQMFKLHLEKAQESEIKLPTSVGSSKKQENSRKTSTSALLTMPKPLTMWTTTNSGKFWKRWEY